jgi:formylglycine-generating enzyme required for sulfatase activity
MAPGNIFRDCNEVCPEMVVVPAGTFTMGSSSDETTREGVPSQFAAWEKPAHEVRISKPFAIAKYPVSVAEFTAFVQDTGFHSFGCFLWDEKGRKFDLDNEKDWQHPGFAQTDRNQPIVCVSWEDTQKYVEWLSRKTGQAYRLPSEAEWEYAARAGTKTARYWGDEIGSGNANCARCGSKWDNKQTSPVGSFKPNAFGLYDMLGNVFQWTEDCWNESYKGSPTDGSAWTTGDCKTRVVRSGSWNFFSAVERAAYRYGDGAGFRSNVVSFRVVRLLP